MVSLPRTILSAASPVAWPQHFTQRGDVVHALTVDADDHVAFRRPICAAVDAIHVLHLHALVASKRRAIAEGNTLQRRRQRFGIGRGALAVVQRDETSCEVLVLPWE